MEGVFGVCGGPRSSLLLYSEEAAEARGEISGDLAGEPGESRQRARGEISSDLGEKDLGK